jgi:hypothetical protein
MIHARTLAACLAMTGLAAAGCHEDATSGAGNPASSATRAAAPPPAPLAAALARAGGHASSVDDRGAPRMLWAVGPRAAHAVAPGTRLDAAARAHVARFAGAWGAERALGSLTFDRVRTLRGGGAVATFHQRIDGVPVVPGRVSVAMRGDGSLVAIGGGLHPGAVPARASAGAFALDARAAVAAALTHTHGAAAGAIDAAALRDAGARGEWARFTLSSGGAALALAEPARAQRVWFAADDGGVLEPAYRIEAFAGPPGGADSDARRWIVSARDGRVLDERSLRAHATYRVWAEPSGDLRPHDGPHADFTPHPTGAPDGSTPAFTSPSLVTVDGFNTPPGGSPDPWLPAGATATTGNNVDAYADLGGGDGFSEGTDFRATPTAPGVFDRVYDTAASPLASQAQGMAAIVHAFYVVNWLHDWWYDAGFDEAAGNAQADNFGRGGADGDRMLLELQDNAQGGSRNNANMSTPFDGSSPRMQIYLWSGASARSVTLSPGGDVPSGVASFGPQAFDVTGTVVMVDDGTAPVGDGCTAPTNAVAGSIALIDRGNCSFVSKVTAAQAAGAIGVLLVNNAPGDGPNSMSGDGAGVTIPVLSLSFEDGNAVKVALQSGAVTATLQRQTAVERDGAVDSGLVAHEWGHYLHHRLADCGATQCGGMSEGWGDFLAVHTAITEGDDLDGAYAAAIYSTGSFPDHGYFGIRRVPYSVDPSINALSFRHISSGEALPSTHPMASASPDNAEVHNAGEIWATMMHEAYVALLKTSQEPGATRTFDQARRAMGEYVVAGLELHPADATFTEARDAILAAAAASSADDLSTLAAAFARRGAGTCAESPPRGSNDLVGVIEDDEVRPRVVVPALAVVDGEDACDGDGVLDAGETAVVEVVVGNAGPVAMTDTSVELSTATPGISFPDGATVEVPTLAAYSTVTLSIPVRAADDLAPLTVVELTATASNASACEATVAEATTLVAARDEVLEASATDDVEASATTWTATGGDLAGVAWARTQLTPGEHAWVGADLGTISDTQLESPDLEVSATEPFTISFTHRFEFEASPSGGGGGDTYWDGAVIELSTDGGASWQDLSTWVEPGYGGTITEESGNPLGGAAAFVATNPSWPGTDEVTYDLGTALAGQTVRVRFRIGTDAAVGATGWQLDDLSFGGIDNTPFAEVVPDAPGCDGPVGPDAGTDPGPDAGDPAVDGDGGDGGCCGASQGGASGPALLLGAVVLGLRRRRRAAR